MGPFLHPTGRCGFIIYAKKKQFRIVLPFSANPFSLVENIAKGKKKSKFNNSYSLATKEAAAFPAALPDRAVFGYRSYQDFTKQRIFEWSTK